MNELTKLTNQIADLQSLIIARQRSTEPLKSRAERSRRLLKLSPRNATLKRETKRLEAELKEQLGDIEDLSLMVKQLEKKKADIRVTALEQELIYEAAQIKAEIHVPDQDPLIGAMLLSAMYENAQYQFITTRQIHERLITKLYTRKDEHGEDKGWDVDDSTNPEINDDLINQVEQFRTKRNYLATLRIAIKQEFERMLNMLTEDAPFTPKLSRRTDEQMEQYLQDRKAARNRNNWLNKQSAAQEEKNTWRRGELPEL